MQTVFEFTLPKGYVDQEGIVHRQGAMRLATALDEIEPLTDPRVMNNEAYLAVIMFSRVITQLGTLRQVTPRMIENFFAVDIAFLQEFYRSVNELDKLENIHVVCPYCDNEFNMEIPLLGEL